MRRESSLSVCSFLPTRPPKFRKPAHAKAVAPAHRAHGSFGICFIYWLSVPSSCPPKWDLTCAHYVSRWPGMRRFVTDLCGGRARIRTQVSRLRPLSPRAACGCQTGQRAAWSLTSRGPRDERQDLKISGGRSGDWLLIREGSAVPSALEPSPTPQCKAAELKNYKVC